MNSIDEIISHYSRNIFWLGFLNGGLVVSYVVYLILFIKKIKNRKESCSMGYSTRFELEIENCNNSTKSKIKKFMNANEDDYYGVLGEDSYKWSNHEETMKTLSLKFPDVLFTLTGEGESSGDVWIKHFKNGKMQERYAELVYPDYDESKFN